MGDRVFRPAHGCVYGAEIIACSAVFRVLGEHEPELDLRAIEVAPLQFEQSNLKPRFRRIFLHRSDCFEFFDCFINLVFSEENLPQQFTCFHIPRVLADYFFADLSCFREPFLKGIEPGEVQLNYFCFRVQFQCALEIFFRLGELAGTKQNFRQIVAAEKRARAFCDKLLQNIFCRPCVALLRVKCGDKNIRLLFLALAKRNNLLIDSDCFRIFLLRRQYSGFELEQVEIILISFKTSIDLLQCCIQFAVP